MMTKRKMIIALGALLLLLAAVFGAAALLDGMRQEQLKKELSQQVNSQAETRWTSENTVTLDGRRYGFDHRIETFLFIGTDENGSSDPENYWGGMADFLLLLVLDHTDNTIAYLQIDRNTVTDVRELTRDGEEITSRELQICTAHWYGRSPEMAAENTVYAVRNYLGGLGKINGYFVMNGRDAGQLNHAVGGVEVTIQDALEKDYPALRQGETVTLTDEQAAYFLRARSTVGEGTNAERMARQRQYMCSFFKKVKEKTSENPAFGLDLWEMIKGAAVSDMNGNAFSRIAQKLLKGTDKGIRTVKGETILGDVLQDGLFHEEFYADDGAVLEAMADLFSLTLIEDEHTTGNGDGT